MIIIINSNNQYRRKRKDFLKYRESLFRLVLGSFYNFLEKRKKYNTLRIIRARRNNIYNSKMKQRKQ